MPLLATGYARFQRFSIQCRRAATPLLAAASLAVLLLGCGALAASAQFGGGPRLTQVRDTTALHPPGTARVAIVEFEDQECPLCGHVNPILKAAVAKYGIPWVRHDFPLKMHAWSFQAAVNARWFDTKSKKLGDEYRDAVFANQGSLYNNPDLLREFTQKFAQSHGTALPFAVDPQGKLAAEVSQDYNLGERMGIDHTPTIWVVTSRSKGAPYIEVTNIENLYEILDQALADTKGK